MGTLPCMHRPSTMPCADLTPTLPGSHAEGDVNCSVNRLLQSGTTAWVAVLFWHPSWYWIYVLYWEFALGRLLLLLRVEVYTHYPLSLSCHGDMVIISGPALPSARERPLRATLSCVQTQGAVHEYVANAALIFGTCRGARREARRCNMCSVMSTASCA